jgi:hypothetical protein
MGLIVYFSRTRRKRKHSIGRSFILQLFKETNQERHESVIVANDNTPA